MKENEARSWQSPGLGDRNTNQNGVGRHLLIGRSSAHLSGYLHLLSVLFFHSHLLPCFTLSQPLTQLSPNEIIIADPVYEIQIAKSWKLDWELVFFLLRTLPKG